MNSTLVIIALIISISLLVFLTVKVKLHPFFALIFASFAFGLVSQMSFTELLDAFSSGLGGTVAGIGIVIALGTVTGALLEKCGAAESMAKAVLRITGEKYAPLGLAITGYFVSIPVFCDSAFVILSSLAKRLSRDTNMSMATMAVALAMGLHTTHMLVPPTPGPLAVAGILGADLGMVIVAGTLISIPVLLVGYLVATKYASKFVYFPKIEEITEDSELEKSYPSAMAAFLPIILPVLLIVLKTVVDFAIAPTTSNIFFDIIRFLGTPMIALLVGLLFALKTYLQVNRDKTVYSFDGEFGEALKVAGQIVLIVGAGGAFGSVLRASTLKDILLEFFAGMNIGILAPFFIGMIFRTAIGSGTVAMITAATMLAPMLDAFGFVGPMGLLVAMLACASGAFMVFHGNDDYFWVVTSASEMDPSVAYKVLPLASVAQSLTALLMAFILKMIVL